MYKNKNKPKINIVMQNLTILGWALKHQVIITEKIKMPIHEQTVYPNRNKFTIPNVCKTVNTTKAANAIIIAFASVMVLSFFILFNP